MMVEICKISHSRKIFVFLPLRWQSRAPPTFSRARHPLALCLVSQIYFGRFFCETEVKPPHPPCWSEVQRRPLLQIQMGGLHYILHILYILHNLHILHILHILQKHPSQQGPIHSIFDKVVTSSFNKFVSQ